MNIKEKERKRAVFLHCAGPGVQDIFDILEDTGDDVKGTAKKLVEYFQLRKHHLFVIYKFQQFFQEKEESSEFKEIQFYSLPFGQVVAVMY